MFQSIVSIVLFYKNTERKVIKIVNSIKTKTIKYDHHILSDAEEETKIVQVDTTCYLQEFLAFHEWKRLVARLHDVVLHVHRPVS